MTIGIRNRKPLAPLPKIIDQGLFEAWGKVVPNPEDYRRRGIHLP